MPYKDPEKRKEVQRKNYLRNRQKIRVRQGSEDQKGRNREGSVARYYKNSVLAQQQKVVPCADCHVVYPHYVMDFDHVRGEKVGNVSALLSNGFSWKSVQEEIDKCEVVCSNCHRVRTYERKYKS